MTVTVQPTNVLIDEGDPEDGVGAKPGWFDLADEGYNPWEH